MCTFDAPIARCEMIHCMVLTDQTRMQCALEHACPEGTVCPWAGYFSEPIALAPVQASKRRVSARSGAGRSSRTNK